MQIDYSTIQDDIKEIAFFYITHGGFISHIPDPSPGRFELVENYLELCRERIQKEKYPFSVFWVLFTLGIELLAKVTLIKHKVDIFSKPNRILVQKPHILTKGLISFDEMKYGASIIAPDNPWLSNLFSQKEIYWEGQLRTCTLNHIYSNKIKELKSNAIISEPEFEQISTSLKHLTNHRRNPSHHFFCKQNVFIRDNDINFHFLPLANLFLDIYCRNGEL